MDNHCILFQRCASLTATLLPPTTLNRFFSHASHTCCSTNKTIPTKQVDKPFSLITSNVDAIEKSSSKGACIEASFFVVTDIGELMLVHLTQDLADLLTLGQTEMSVTWIGALEDAADGGHVICVVHCTGSAMILDPAASSTHPPLSGIGPQHPYRWRCFNLDHYVVCCCGVGSSLVMSDGHSVTVTDLSWKKRRKDEISPFVEGGIKIGSDEKLEGKIGGYCCDDEECARCEGIMHSGSSVNIFGVVGITFDDMLTLKTVDGRKYQYTWEQFKKKARIRSGASRSESCGTELSEDVSGPSIEEVMKGIERCAELQSAVQRQSNEVDTFMEQLNFAQHLHDLAGTKNANVEVTGEQFKLSYFVRPSTHHENVFYLVVSLTCRKVGLDFNSKWWRMRVTVPSETGFKHVSVKLKENLTDNVVVIGMTKTEANRLLLQDKQDCENSLALRCDVILNDFSNTKPIISTEVAREKLCVFRFLNNQRQTGGQELNPSLSFEQILYTMHDMDCDDYSVPKQVQRISLFFPHSDQLVSRLNELTNFFNLEHENSSTTNHTKKNTVNSGEHRLWFLDNSVNIKLTSTTDKITVVVSSVHVPLAIAVKREFEDCFRKTCESGVTVEPDADQVNISQKTVRDVHVTQRLLDASLDEALSSSQAGVVRNLYEHLSLLINSLP